MTIRDLLTELVQTFPNDVGVARKLATPNHEDDLVTKTAIVGFSYNCSAEKWDLGHYEFLTRRLEQELPNEELSNYDDNPENLRLFYALSLGYLLGLYQSSLATDEEFRIAEHQIPGIIMLHLPKITEHPI